MPRSRTHSDALSEDDLDLLDENWGHPHRPGKATAPEKASKRRRLLPRKRSRRSGSDASDDNDKASDGEDESGGEQREKDPDASDLKRIFDDRPRHGDEDEDEDDGSEEDDLADFIEDDAHEGEDEEQRRERKRQEKERRKSRGISKSTWDDIYDVFGDVSGDGEYDWALEGEDEMLGAAGDGLAPTTSDILEPDEIKARFLTEEDDLIRARDIPERHQLLNSTLSANPTYIPEPFPVFPPVETASLWIAPRISARTKAFLSPKLESCAGAGLGAAEGDVHRHFIEAVQRVLGYLFVEHLEVPFIWEHRRDYIVHYRKNEQGNAPSATDSGSGRVCLLERNELWKVYELGTKYRSLMRRKDALDTIWNRLRERKKEAWRAELDVIVDENGAEISPTQDGPAPDVLERYYTDKIDGSGGLAEEGIEGVMDAMEWVGLRWARELREMREEEDEAMKARGERRQKRPNEGAIKRAAELREGRAGSALRNMGISPEEAISKNLFQPPTAMQEDPDLPPDEWAEAYVDGRQFSSTEAVLKGLRTLQVADFAANPTLRQSVRQLYREHGLLTIRPTEKGLAKIDEFHPYSSFKYLKNKPVVELAQSTRFLHYLAAEKDTLVAIRFSLPQEVQDRLERGVIEAFTSAGDGEIPNTWNAWREHNIKAAVRNELLPMGERWVKEWLRDEVEDFVAGSCGELLEKAANQAPYRPKEYEKGSSPSVMAVSHGRGDSMDDAVMCVYIDKRGRIRETIEVGHLRDKPRFFTSASAGKTHPTDAFKAFVRKRQPACIVIGGFTVATHDHVFNRVRALVGELAEEKVNNQHRDDQGGSRWGGSGWTDPAELERELAQATLPVIYVPDAAAQLYQHSERSKKEFRKLSLTVRYCVGLGRYVQSPIHEYCALRADITAITFDESQKLVPNEKLYVAFERALVNVVNDVGVMINDTVTDAYQQSVLPFVAGLGPRKATKLVRDIIKDTSNGALINRNELLTAELLGSVICKNGIGSLKISHDLERLEITGDNIEGQPDPLDSTRIHPEEYELARRMADRALELEEGDVDDVHPSRSVLELMLDDSTEDKLNSLNLDDFADSPRELRHVEKRYALHVIKDEMASPGRERRDDFRPPTDWEVLTMLSGQTPSTLQPGFIIAGHIWRVRDKMVNIRLDTGVEAIVDIRYVADRPPKSCHQVARVGPVRAMIIGVFPERMLAELSMRKTELDMGDAEQRRVRTEEPYDWERAQADKAALDEAARAKKELTKVNRARRQSDHPNFSNVTCAEAEQYLATQQRGDCVIRPSSLGFNHLAVTWKVDDGVYQHLDVQEHGKPCPQMVGQLLRVADKYDYKDLDELIVKHIKQTARKVNELIKHDKFKGRSQEELHSFLRNYTMANPGKSIYGFGLNRERPGYFDLAFLTKPTTEGGVIQTWPVKVNPGTYVLGEAEVGGMLELCNSFKTQYAERLRQSQAAAALEAASEPWCGPTPPWGRHQGGA